MNTVIETPTIIQTTEGLKIADTQMSLHPIVDLLKSEWPESLVQMRFELTDQQMADILAYIDQHPQEVDIDHAAGRKRAEENRRTWWEQLGNEPEEEWPTWWPDDATPGTVIHIIETKGGPMISNSRVSVYDVMEVYDDGSLPYEIPQIYNLSPHQVKVALQYIEAHREILEPKLKKILARKVERERNGRAYQAAYIKWRREITPLEMTPKREALRALLEERRRARSEI